MKTLEELKDHIADFKLTEVRTSAELSDAFKIAKALQDNYRQTSDEFKLLETFKKFILRQLSLLKPTIKVNTKTILDDNDPDDHLFIDESKQED